MNLSTIAQQRMLNQGLTRPLFDNPAEVVAWSGAVQSQNYAGAKWAVAQRTQGFPNDAAMEQAYNEGAILRTHVLRPTWHFVAPADIRWMLNLTAPRVNVASTYYYRTLGLGDALFAQSNDAIAKALEGGKHLTRAELGAALQHAGIEALDLRLTYLVMRAELDGVICSGPRRGKQFTFALLEERVPPATTLAEDESLAELAKRYFTSHGPALLKDFVWWSGLTVSEAKEGIELLGSTLQHETINGQSYWSATSMTPNYAPISTDHLSVAYLLPNYDEALASFKDYSAAVAPQFTTMWENGDAIFAHYIVINGWIVGSWKRTLAKKSVQVEIKPFAPLTDAQSQAITAAAHRFGNYLGLSAAIQTLSHAVGKNVG